MKRVMMLIFVVVMMGLWGGCRIENVDNSQRKETDRLMTEANSKVGMPNINNFYEKKLVKWIYELRDDSDLICYVYQINEITGKYIYLNKCIGYGIPYAIQYSNPEKVVQGDHELGYDFTGVNNIMKKAQAEPNGLFTGGLSTSATWVIMINPETGEPKPVYCEQKITIYPFKARRELCDPKSLPEDY